ncbi:hypothetical protein [Ensifer canadensis]
MTISLNSVQSVAATAEPNVFILSCNITDINNETYDCDYCSRPEDTFGLNPTVRQWILDNPEFPIHPYVAPTAEEIRSSFPDLTARQFRLGMVKAGIGLSAINGVIDQMPAGPEKDMASIEWEYATTFSRMHPLVGSISMTLGLSAEEVDLMWNNALAE